MLRQSIFSLLTIAGLTGALSFTPQASAQNFGIGYSNGHGTALGIRIGGPSYPPVVGYPTRSYYPPVAPVLHHYDVLYRTCHSEPWRVYGTYHSHQRAHQIEDYLEAYGYDARIAHH